jgi:hypothetical protein
LEQARERLQRRSTLEATFGFAGAKAGKKNPPVMGRKAPLVVHRLSLAEQRVLASFLSGRLPAGQVHNELERARLTPEPATPAPSPSATPVPAVAA